LPNRCVGLRSGRFLRDAERFVVEQHTRNDNARRDTYDREPLTGAPGKRTECAIAAMAATKVAAQWSSAITSIATRAIMDAMTVTSSA